MDKNTFGNSKAAINLVNTLNEPEYQDYAHKACNILSLQLGEIHAINNITDDRMRKAVLNSWHQRFRTKVNGSTLPENIKTHILCVATTYYRIALKTEEVKHGKSTVV